MESEDGCEELHEVVESLVDYCVFDFLGVLCCGCIFDGIQEFLEFLPCAVPVEPAAAAACTEKLFKIVSGREVISYNVGFDFGKFLYQEPWCLRSIVTRRIDIMKLATSKVYELADSDSIEDKGLQERLLREREDSPYPEKWVRSIDAYRVLCPEDPLKLEGMRHRAIDDAVMEGHILRYTL